MPGRYKQTGNTDEESLMDTDPWFVSVDMRQDPSLLQQGVASEATNIEFRQGVALPRNGFQTRPWAHELGKSFPWDFPIDFSEPVGFGKMWGAIVVQDPFENEWTLLAGTYFAYQISDNGVPQVVRYPSGLTLDSEVNFTQAFDTLIMWRGEELDPLKLDVTQQFGSAMIFEVVPSTVNANYTATIPPAKRGLHYGNRIWVGYDRSRIAYSDILQYTRFDPLLSTLFVNEGDSDTLQVLIPSPSPNNIVAFKDGSIYALINVLPSPGATSRIQNITHQHGTIAPDSVAQVGGDIFFLASDGVYPISQALDNQLQAGTEPLSAPLQPLFERVNWDAAPRAQAVYHEGKYIIALPIDGASHNNAMAIYDFVAGGWTGWWEFQWLDVFRLMRMTSSGRKRLLIVSGDALDDSNKGALFLHGDYFLDQRFTEEADVQTMLLTRGYTPKTFHYNPITYQGTKSFYSQQTEIATWHGAGKIEAVRDGVGEENDQITFSKDRTKYSIFGMPDYDTSNSGCNHGDPYREDYSVELTQGGIDFCEGIAVGLHQISTESSKLRQHGNHIQIRIEGTRGRVAVRSVKVFARLGREPIRSTLI